MHVFILCGGKGTRLADISNGKQKCSLEINDKPFLIHLIINIAKYFPIKSICLCVGHSADDITSIKFDKYLNKSIEVNFSIETKELGTGGALKHAIKENTNYDELMICNGDSICSVSNIHNDYLRLSKKEYAGIIATAFSSKTDRYGSLKVDEKNRIVGFAEKSLMTSTGIINAGIYIIRKGILVKYLMEEVDSKFSFERNILSKLVSLEKIYIADPTESFIDIGIPEDFNRTSSFLKNLL